ncbi:hypothetical protein GLOTRDRAFT_132522 [Gloeophyllum trabeum ATCC 11539]|uniref:Uncharacterized protein n=1 Tax=Gloeophyllum trabeum (strain ATCC 11539 / FP-39264 / Madison 617) TaxID=670483 RepID=S7PWH9_GLOTA|nr:uncharacterized protein GLOTRDRAFT_132522 [Gloeophyllum trabeum ATCC 11539]EPQ51702.1 hypothetical protein GLOTRDRAFT_132522 [Gloeophyllum trabeum ATCC 11539]
MATLLIPPYPYSAPPLPTTSPPRAQVFMEVRPRCVISLCPSGIGTPHISLARPEDGAAYVQHTMGLEPDVEGMYRKGRAFSHLCSPLPEIARGSVCAGSLAWDATRTSDCPRDNRSTSTGRPQPSGMGRAR